jgi:hypothetical protein
MSRKVIAIAFGLCIASSLAAHANSEAEACYAKLSAEGRLIFDTVKAELTPDTRLRPMVRDKTMELFRLGKVSKKTAPQSGMAAAACLELLPK